MGYETTLLFVEKYPKKNGLQKIIATIDLEKADCDQMGILLEELRMLRKDSQSKYSVLYDEYRKLDDKIYDAYGDYTKLIQEMKQVFVFDDWVNELEERLTDNENALKKALPYVYYEQSSKPNFVDAHGCFLMVTTVNKVHDALLKDNKKNPRREYDVAIAICKAFMCRKQSGIRVILWGH